MTKKKTAFEMAKEYYPRLWSKERLEVLKENGKLTQDEYNSIVNKKQ